MIYLQIGLLAALALLLLLVLLRLGELLTIRRSLDRLDSLGVLESLPGRLARLEERLESLRATPPPPAPPEPSPVTVRVDMADDLREAVRSAVGELERDLKKILRLAGRSRRERTGARITQRLLDEGYSKIRITAGLPRTRSPEARVRVPVDAERDAMPHRGVVVLRGSEIEEVRLAPLHRMFP